MLTPTTPTTAPPTRDTGRFAAGGADDTRKDLPALGAGVVTYPGVDLHGPAADRFCQAVLATYRGGHLVLDLTAVRSVDGAGLLAIASLARACRSRGGSLTLSGPTPAVRALLAAVGVHRYADVSHTPAHALRT